MVYNYYMKKTFSWLCATACVVSFSLCAWAQMTVVRVDGTKIYLDTSDQKTAPTNGSTFKVILSSEKLTNPKTGKDLGEIYKYSDTGTITEVQPLYAIGQLKNTTGVTVGKQAVFEEIKLAIAASVAEPEPATPVSTRAKKTYAPVEQVVIGLTQADVTAPGANNIITLSDKNEITVFSRGEKDVLTAQLSYTLPSDKKGLSVSAAPVKEGLAQIFVPVLNTNRAVITTLVLENQNGTLTQTGTLNYFVKELGCGADKKIWAQRPFVLGTAPGNAREVVFEKNKFVASGADFNTKHNWLSGSNYYPVETAEKNNFITTATNGVLRLSLNNGKNAESKDKFGSSPNRVQYKQDILKFHPSVQVFGTPGQATLAAVENTTKLGLLSSMFGQYQTGKVHFLDYEKGRLKITDTVDLDGVIYDTACTQDAILAAEVLADETSSIVEISK